MPMPLERGQEIGLPEVAPLRARNARLLRGICEDLDDAIRAINWSRNVRFQLEISEAVTNLREWAALSAASIADDC